MSRENLIEKLISKLSKVSIYCPRVGCPRVVPEFPAELVGLGLGFDCGLVIGFPVTLVGLGLGFDCGLVIGFPVTLVGLGLLLEFEFCFVIGFPAGSVGLGFNV